MVPFLSGPGKRQPDTGWPLSPWTAQILTELGQRGYTLSAWVRLFSTSWRTAQETARCNADLTRAWRRLSWTLLTLSILPVALAWRRHGSRQAGRLSGVLLIGLIGQQADAYVHLGLNRRLHDDALLTDLGPALWLSYLRSTTAQWLLAATITGQEVPGLISGALVVGAVTDTLDGPVARHQRRPTKLGAYVDGEADIVLAVALTRAAVRRGTLLASAYGLLAARYALPIAVGCVVAINRAHPPRLAHTLAGRLCGVAQVALLGCALAPRRWQWLLDGPRRLLLPVAAALNVASGVSQTWRVMRSLERQG